MSIIDKIVEGFISGLNMKPNLSNQALEAAVITKQNNEIEQIYKNHQPCFSSKLDDINKSIDKIKVLTAKQ